MTKRLYYTDPYLRRFSAQVLACEKEGDHYIVVLDRTAFYPEGGGQAADTGSLGGVTVRDVRLVGEAIWHICSRPLTVGKRVRGEISWSERFQRMQDHSGEHIVSGLIHEKFGYENVGFHMGADAVTVDFSGVLTEQDLAGIFKEANGIVTKNVPLNFLFPDAETLKALPYRSKKELTGEVRLVEIPGADLCACCGTHVLRTGEIGPILLLSRESFREGTRISMICGGRAQEYIANLCAQNKRLMALFSARPYETADFAEKMAEELGKAKQRIADMTKAMLRQTAEAYRGMGDVLLFAKGLDSNTLGHFAAMVAEASGGLCAVCVPKGQGCTVAVSGADALSRGKEFLDLLGGRGGGRDHLIQGSVPAEKEKIENAWKQVTK